MSTQSPSDFLRENADSYDPDKPKRPGVSWENQPDGYTIEGEITEAPKVVMVKSKKDNGEIVTEPKLIIEMTLTAPIDVTITDANMMVKKDQATEVNLWVGKGTLAGALDAATQAAGEDLKIGGILAVKLTGRKSTGKPKPLNLFTAAYKPPAPPAPTGASVSSLLGGS